MYFKTSRVCNESKADGGGETGSGRQGHRQILIKAGTLGLFMAIRTFSLNPGQMLMIGVDLAYWTAHISSGFINNYIKKIDVC